MILPQFGSEPAIAVLISGEFAIEVATFLADDMLVAFLIILLASSSLNWGGDFSDKNYSVFDLHRPYLDDIILVSEDGEKMVRERDLIDVWFDSGSMPYAQMH